MVKKEKNLKYIGFYLDEKTKNKWVTYSKSHGYSSLSKLIREAVDFYIDSNLKISYIKNFSKISQKLKRPLISIKGFSQLMLEHNSESLNLEILEKIREIFKSSQFLEKQINNLFQDETSKEKFDILIIDSHFESDIILTEWFKKKGFKVKFALTIDDGLKILENTIPKAILLDTFTDREDIITVYNNIREIVSESSKIYLISSLNEKELLKIVKKTNANGYFLKPYNLNDFNSLKLRD